MQGSFHDCREGHGASVWSLNCSSILFVFLAKFTFRNGIDNGEYSYNDVSLGCFEGHVWMVSLHYLYSLFLFAKSLLHIL